ncbi:type II toxin-antitoxin system HicA family toxin [Thermodesulfobacteriota bacterium]
MRSSRIIDQFNPQSGGKSTITIPIPDNNEIRIGTLQSIIHQSGLDRSEFES